MTIWLYAEQKAMRSKTEIHRRQVLPHGICFA